MEVLYRRHGVHAQYADDWVPPPPYPEGPLFMSGSSYAPMTEDDWEAVGRFFEHLIEFGMPAHDGPLLRYLPYRKVDRRTYEVLPLAEAWQMLKAR